MDTHKTFNRGMLKRLAQQGKLEMVESYNFDDMHGESRSKNVVPVKEARCIAIYADQPCDGLIVKTDNYDRCERCGMN